MQKISKLLTAAVTAAALVMSLAACSSDAASDSAAPAAAAPSASAEASPTPTPSAAVGSVPAAVGQTAITITAAGRTITATLNDSDVSRDLVEMLPVTLPWFRQGSIEYITELDAPLTETGPFYTDVEAGDIVYYNPADSFTIIYAPTSSVPTLTKMGEITSDLRVFQDLPDNVDMTLALA